MAKEYVFRVKPQGYRNNYRVIRIGGGRTLHDPSCSAPMGMRPIFIKKTDMKIAAPGSSPEAAI